MRNNVNPIIFEEIFKNIDCEAYLEIIKLLLAVANPSIKDELIHIMIDLIGYIGCGDNKKDYKFLLKTFSKTQNKIQKYFHQKDMKEIAEYKLSQQ